MDSPELSVMQRRVLDYVVRYINEKHMSPTEREIAKGIRRSSTAVRLKLERLIELGYVRRNRGPRGAVMARSLEVLKRPKKSLANGAPERQSRVAR